MKKGFTLVELSIVLVIIGLLIGGILAAQSMIQSSKIQAFVRQIDQFDAAMANFKTKYNSLPGDSTFFPGTGDNNGIIEDSELKAAASTYVKLFDDEVSNAWTHLSLSGFEPGTTYSNDGSAGVKLGINIPKAKLGQNAGVLIYRNNASGGRNQYFMGDWTKTANNQVNTGATSYYNPFTPIEVFAVDTKIDDGLRGGIVTAYSIIDDGTKCYKGGVGSAYYVNNNLECTMQIKILRNSNDF